MSHACDCVGEPGLTCRDAGQSSNSGQRSGRSRICHELTRLAASIVSLAKPALEEPGLSPAMRRYFERIVRQANWLADMVEDFLRQLRPGGVPQDARQPGPAPRETAPRETAPRETVPAGTGGADVADAVHEAVEFAGLTWPGRAVVRSPSGQDRVRCGLPPVLLRRVIWNVLSNATRAAGPSGTVTIQVGRADGVATLSVRDSGPGFGRIPAGSGIGLTAAARIIARYDGRIEFGSGTGGGACVSLWLP